MPQVYTMTVPRGPWYCVLGPNFEFIYLGTDKFDADVAAKMPGAGLATAERMGDAQVQAVFAVSAARRALSSKSTVRTAPPEAPRVDRLSAAPAVSARRAASVR